MNLRKLLGLVVLILMLLTPTSCNRKDQAGSIILGGDVFLARSGIPIYPDEERLYSPFGVVEEFRKLQPDSMFFINLESPLRSSASLREDIPLERNLCASSSQARFLLNAGVNFASLANNHAEDCSDNGQENTKEILEDINIASQGRSQSPLYLGNGNQRISLFTLDDVSATLDLSGLDKQIAKARQQSALVVISIHWGKEYQHEPTSRQRELAQYFADCGADIIWGHHPHVLQPMELLTSTKDGHQALVLYSLGNLIADQWFLEDTQRSSLVKVDFQDHEILAVSLMMYQMEPLTMQLINPVSHKVQQQILGELGVAEIFGMTWSVELINPLE